MSVLFLQSVFAVGEKIPQKPHRNPTETDCNLLLGLFSDAPVLRDIKNMSQEERRIYSLILKLDSHDQKFVDLSDFVTAAANPKHAKRRWLESIFIKRGWIDTRSEEEFKSLSVDKALLKLNDLMLQKAKLRSIETGVIRATLPAPGVELGVFIKDDLVRRGYDPEKLMIRFLLDSEYLPDAVSTGNDRTSPRITTYYHHGGYDGEELAMIRHGITDARDTTYLSRLKNWKNASRENHFTVLIYSADTVEGIGPLGNMKSNGFHSFLFDGEVKRRSLIAVYSR